MAPHGTYRGAYPNEASRREAREWLNLPQDAKVALNLGIMRSYKKVERLIETAREHPDITVIIAGMVDEDGYEPKLRALAEGLPNARLVLDFVPESDLQYYLNAADVFALPCDKITNSGSAILSLSFGLPILAPGSALLRIAQKPLRGRLGIHLRGRLRPRQNRRLLRRLRAQAARERDRLARPRVGRDSPEGA